MLNKVKAMMFYYILRPIFNRFLKHKYILTCPCCGELLQYYNGCGYIHLSDGDADCYGTLGKGKGLFK